MLLFNRFSQPAKLNNVINDMQSIFIINLDYLSNVNDYDIKIVSKHNDKNGFDLSCDKIDEIIKKDIISVVNICKNCI